MIVNMAWYGEHHQYGMVTWYGEPNWPIPVHLRQWVRSRATEKSRAEYVIRCGLFQQSPSICSEPVPVGFSQKLAVLVLEGEVGGEVAVDVVGFDVVVYDGHLAG